MIPAAKTTNQTQGYFHRTFRATITAEQLMSDYKELGQWQLVAKKHNVAHNYIIMARKMLGIFEKTLTKGKQYGGLHSRCTKNGGINIDSRGYVKVGRYHPDNTKGYTVYQHILVVEKHLGRSLLPGESIHHIDGNKSNNNLNNLFLCNHSIHRKAESSALNVIYELYKSGVVDFNKNTHKYYIKNEHGDQK